MGNEFKFQKVDEDKVDSLILEHYKRCKDFCLSYNTTIWSMPSVATAINVGTYYALFDMNKKLESYIVLLTLFILTLLNIALTIGITRHLHFQRQFGKRIMEIERQNGLPLVELDNGNRVTKIKAGGIYIFAMVIISLVSCCLFVQKLICLLT
jgi:hypothetical protein